MNLYIQLWIFLALVSLIQPLIKKKYHRIIYCFGAIFSICVMAFRDFSSGFDTGAYCKAYKYISTVSWPESFKLGWEIGYLLLNKILTFISNEPRFLLVALAFITLTPIFYIIGKASSYSSMSLLMYVSMGYLMMSSLNRQCCAITILCFSWKYIRERKFIRMLIVVIIAMAFHRTAAIFIIIYFLYELKIKNISILFSVFFSVFFGMFGNSILFFLNKFARIQENMSFNGGISILILFLILFFLIYIILKSKINNEEYHLYAIMLLVAAVLQPIAFTFSMWSRIIVFFSMPVCILVPNTIRYLSNTSRDNKRISFLINIALIIGLFIYFMIGIPSNYSFMKIR